MVRKLFELPRCFEEIFFPFETAKSEGTKLNDISFDIRVTNRYLRFYPRFVVKFLIFLLTSFLMFVLRQIVKYKPFLVFFFSQNFRISGNIKLVKNDRFVTIAIGVAIKRMVKRR